MVGFIYIIWIVSIVANLTIVREFLFTISPSKRGCLISTRQPPFIQVPIGEGMSFKQISEPFFNYETASW